MTIINNYKEALNVTIFIEGVLASGGSKVYKQINLTFIGSSSTAPYFVRPIDDLSLKIDENIEDQSSSSIFRYVSPEAIDD